MSLLNRVFASTSLAGLALALVSCSSPAPKTEAVAEPAPAAVETAPAALETPTPPPATHALVGTVKTVHGPSKKLVVVTHDGAEHEVHVHPESPIHAMGQDLKQIGKGFTTLAKDGKDEAVAGSKVVVHYTEVGGKKIGSAVKTGTDESVKTTKVVVTKVADGTRTVVGKSEDGVEHAFHWTKDTTVTVGNKLVDGSKGIGEHVKKGSEMVVHFTQKQNTKLAHAIEHVGETRN